MHLHLASAMHFIQPFKSVIGRILAIAHTQHIWKEIVLQPSANSRGRTAYRAICVHRVHGAAFVKNHLTWFKWRASSRLTLPHRGRITHSLCAKCICPYSQFVWLSHRYSIVRHLLVMSLSMYTRAERTWAICLQTRAFMLWWTQNKALWWSI